MLGPATYFIVEAKGVGAGLTYKPIGPPDEIKQQMSLGWVLDNLVRMERNGYKIAKKILAELGLTEKLNTRGKPYYEGYGGASKNYYACSFDASMKTANLIGVVITASWNSTGWLSDGPACYWTAAIRRVRAMCSPEPGFSGYISDMSEPTCGGGLNRCSVSSR